MVELGFIESAEMRELGRLLKEKEAELVKLRDAGYKKRRAIAKYEEENKLLYFNKPGHSRLGKYGKWEYNEVQREYFDYALKNPEFLIYCLTGGNRFGKCLVGSSLVEVIGGEVSIGELYKRGESFKVKSWDGVGIVEGDACAPFKKEGLHECYRIEMKDGRIIDAADKHLVLTGRGWMYVSDLANIFSNNPADIHELFEPLYGGHTVVSIKPIGVNECYDFSVEKYHNYFSGGLINHNTFTTTGCSAISLLRGHYPWEDPAVVGRWLWDLRKWRPPIKVRIVGQDWEKHIKSVVVPTLKELVPKTWNFKVRKNNVGVEAYWTDPETGGSLEIMSNNSEPEVFEGSSNHVVIYDEPPKRDVRIACARGLIDNNGIEIFAMTLLKEAWVDKDVLNKVDENGCPDKSVYSIIAESNVNVGFGISEAGLKQFASNLTPEEYNCRIRGIPSYKAGLVLDFKKTKHVIDRFVVPSHWLIDISIDIGVSKPHDILYIATAQNGFKYVCFHDWVRGDGDAIADAVIKRKLKHGLRINRVVCDVLAKGDKNNFNSTWEKIDIGLNRYGMYLEPGTKDKEDGVIIINSYLNTVNGMPALFVFRDLVRPIDQISNWMQDKNGEISKDNDDNCENLYRLMLMDTKFFEPRDDRMEEDHKTYSHSINRVTGY
jgi:hypothetical protein